MVADIAFRIGSGLLAFAALGFGIPAVIGAAHTARTGSTWRLWGFPAYDPTAFERWGVRLPAVGLMIAFAVVCALAVIAAVLLWIPPLAPAAAVAGLVLILAQAVFWAGFVLPFGPPAGILAAIALAVGLATRPGG